MEEKEQFNGLLLGQLAKIKRWTKFLSVLSYIATVLMVVIGVVMGVFGTNLSSLGDAYSAVPGPLFAKLFSFWGIVTAIALALYFLIIILAIVIGISGLG